MVVDYVAMRTVVLLECRNVFGHRRGGAAHMHFACMICSVKDIQIYECDRGHSRTWAVLCIVSNQRAVQLT